ncbi:MAG: Diphosphomevalonate decarboxylase/isopentenyl-diphosphate delta-isomerase [Alphaproteobacteria bacterium]|jgi:diphosphomevalonate decarboxylase|nr:Diphosphomevalonate decarboxylase/isopentenyl-diphosphate delta-isomerase [Alphaproteobacteria bacterium]
MKHKEYVILVNDLDEEIGREEKMAAHELGLLHRAFSIFIFRKEDNQLQLLLQRRHPHKYHCGNLWTNTCCSHPRPGETVMEAAQRRLEEEMGFKAQILSCGTFQYTAPFDNGLVENELDHVLVGFADPETIKPDPDEVSDYRWVSINQLKDELEKTPGSFTPWFHQALEVALKTDD